MIKNFLAFGKWRAKDVKFLNSLNLPIIIQENYQGIPIEDEEILKKIKKYYSQKDSLFTKNKPLDFSISFQSVNFSKEELETAKSYATILGKGKLHYIWNDANTWKKALYDSVCDSCFSPKGNQLNPWVLKREVHTEKLEFLGFEGLPGYVFCNKKLATLVKKEFGIDSMPVLIGKKQQVSKHLVQLDIPISPYKLIMENNRYGDSYESNNWTYCNSCTQDVYTNQERDFFPPFEKDFDFDLVLTQEWFGWYRRTVVSKRFMEFCFEHKILKRWKPIDSRYIPQAKK